MIYQLTSQFTRDSKNDVNLGRVSKCINYILKLWKSIKTIMGLWVTVSVKHRICTGSHFPVTFWLRKGSSSVEGAGQKYKGCLILHVTWPPQNRRLDWQVTFPIAPVNRWSCFQHNFTLSRATCLCFVTLQLTERKIGKQEHHKQAQQ